MNKPKTYQCTKVQQFLHSYWCAAELCEAYPKVDDIFSGVLALKTAGDTATRTLSRQVLFHILQWCPTIDVDSINIATNKQYAYNTLAGYAAKARVAAKAIERYMDTLPQHRRLTVRQEQEALDAPYMAELAQVMAHVNLQPKEQGSAVACSA